MGYSSNPTDFAPIFIPFKQVNINKLISLPVEFDDALKEREKKVQLWMDYIKSQDLTPEQRQLVEEAVLTEFLTWLRNNSRQLQGLQALAASITQADSTPAPQTSHKQRCSDSQCAAGGSQTALRPSSSINSAQLRSAAASNKLQQPTYMSDGSHPARHTVTVTNENGEDTQCGQHL